MTTTQVLAVGLVVLTTGLTHQRAQQPSCLHGPNESAEQARRRSTALGLARQINSTEAAAKIRGNTYYVLSDLPGLASEVEGFKVQLSTDGATYTFAIKDTVDPCRFAYFSDQDGVIYSGTPIR